MNFGVKDYGLNGKAAYVYGLGSSGMGVAEALRESGASVAVWDDKPITEARGFRVVSPLEVEWERVGALVKSPGIPMTAKPVQDALVHGVPVVGDVDLLWRREKTSGVEFIGITGTNGKSTTTALVAHVLKENGIKVAMGGNIGVAAMTLPELPEKGVYVLELSSYQLEMMQELCVDGAVFLNLTPDHLSRHGTMQVYMDTKLRLMNLAKDGARKVIGIDQPEMAEVAAERDCVTVGRGTQMADYVIRDGKVWEGREAKLELPEFPHLRGPHNAQNVACAYALLVPRWVSHEQFVGAAKSFMGLPHRLELVGTVDGVRFVNDSKATNGDSTLFALQSYDDIYWICGGEPKTDGLGASLHNLAPVRAAFTIGAAADAFADTLKGRGVPSFACHTLDMAVRAAFAAARSEGREGAVVMLSPAAASFDQFRNFEHRGDVFVNLVHTLASEAPERRFER